MDRPRTLDGRRPDRSWDVASAVLLLALAVLMGSTFRDYGVTADEGVQQRYGRRIVRWYATLGGDRSATEKSNLYLYGGAFELAAQAVQRVSPLGVYESRHLANATFGLAGIVAAWGLGRCLAGAAAGFASALFLALTPGYYGHVFANPKDVPFAALYTAAAWAILRAAERDRLRPLSGRVALAGVAVGLRPACASTASCWSAFAALLWGASGWTEVAASCHPGARPSSSASPSRCCCVVAWAVMLACWPWAQVAPSASCPRAADVLRFRRQSRPVRRRESRRARCRARYVPKLFALTLPEFYPVACALGVFEPLRAGGFAARRPDAVGPARRLGGGAGRAAR